MCPTPHRSRDKAKHCGAGRQACGAESRLGFSSIHAGVIFNRAFSR